MIKDLMFYNREMSKSLDDKVWFLLHLSHKDLAFIDKIVDVGCADGRVPAEIVARVGHLMAKDTDDSKLRIFGIDADPRQEREFIVNNPNSTFQSDMSQISRYHMMTNALVLLNSVLHETPGLLADSIAMLNPKFIAIRDMALSTATWPNRFMFTKFFQARFSVGPNGAHEIEEEYFQLNADLFMEAPKGYKTVVCKHEVLPWAQHNVLPPVFKDIPTHMYVLYQRK